MTSPIPGIIRYPGGKRKLFREINQRLERMIEIAGNDLEYREPFFGAGAVGLSLLARHRSIRKVWLNDADPAIAMLWDVVIHNPSALHVMVESLTEAMRLFPECDYYKANVEILRGTRDVRPEVLAMAKIVVHQMSYSGLGPMAGGAMTDKLARYNVERLVGKCYSSHELLASVTLRRDTCTCLDFARMFDEGVALFYLDPPYYAAGPDLYQFSFSDQDHERLADTLKRESRPWLLSYDDHPFIRKLYKSWARIEVVTVVYSIKRSTQKSELLISNSA